ncbi:hypothetical protein [Cohnella yongneupensis]|uniref:Uncharacterized protein n=1 Tax=Cohnella yongneupensis TaxID=425006 RepID=A0ABW0QU02_9BACL
MGEFFGYMCFSMFEGFALYSLMFYLFRFDVQKHFWPVIIMITITNLQSFFIREELSLTTISPIINIILICLFLIIIIRIPIVWSMFMAIAGYIGLLAFQLCIVALSNGYLSFNEIQNVEWKGYLFQLISGVLVTSVGWLLYRFGYGFSYDFAKKFQFKWERPFIITFVICFILSLGVMMYIKAVYTNLVIVFAALIILLAYSFKKEAEE